MKSGKSVLTMRHLATLQPRVPEPSRRHLVLQILSKSRSGINRQRINFRLRSTAEAASLGMTKTVESREKRSILQAEVTGFVCNQKSNCIGNINYSTMLICIKKKITWFFFFAWLMNIFIRSENEDNLC